MVTQRQIIFIACFLAAALMPAQGQLRKDKEIGRSNFFGYVANIPNQFIGLGAGQFGEGLLGYHVELRFATLKFPEVKHISERTADYGPTGNTYQNYLTANAALNYGVTDQIIAYGGVGVTLALEAQEYVSFRGGGKQWFRKDNSASLNVHAGVFYRIAGFYLQGGFEINPGGFVVGIGF